MVVQCQLGLSWVLCQGYVGPFITMKPVLLLRPYACLPLLAGVVHGYVALSTLATDLEATKSLAKLTEVLESGKLKEYLGFHGVKQQCTASTVAKRRE